MAIIHLGQVCKPNLTNTSPFPFLSFHPTSRPLMIYDIRKPGNINADSTHKNTKQSLFIEEKEDEIETSRFTEVATLVSQWSLPRVATALLGVGR